MSDNPPLCWLEELPCTPYAWVVERFCTNGFWRTHRPVPVKITQNAGEEPLCTLLENTATRFAGDTFRAYDGDFLWLPLEAPARPEDKSSLRFRVLCVDVEGRECDLSFETRNDHLFPWLEKVLGLKSSGAENDEWIIELTQLERVMTGVASFNDLYNAQMKVEWL